MVGNAQAAKMQERNVALGTNLKLLRGVWCAAFLITERLDANWCNAGCPTIIQLANHCQAAHCLAKYVRCGRTRDAALRGEFVLVDIGRKHEGCSFWGSGDGGHGAAQALTPG